MTNALRLIIAAAILAAMPTLSACGPKRVPTKAQWMQRYKEIVKDNLKVPRKEFTYALGEPTSTQPIDNCYLWIYQLADGQIHLKILKYPLRKRDEVFVTLLTEF